MELSQFYNLPFTKSAAKYVDSLDVELLDIVYKSAYDMPLNRAESRIVQALEGDIEKPKFADSEITEMEVELLSYPIARLLLSCIGDLYAIRRYALKEAKSSDEFLRNILSTMDKEEAQSFLEELARELGVGVKHVGESALMSLTSYLRYASHIHEPRWKLVNREVERGMVVVRREEMLRLLQEAVRMKVEEGMPLTVPSEVCKRLSMRIGRIRALLEEKKARFEESVRGPERTYPPCIREAMRLAREGMNIPHSQRFALTSFLLTIGWSVQEVVELFASSPDFDEKMATYQVEHIAGSTGTVYTPPSCATMQTYGNCIGKDELCARVSHPLTYYRRRVKGWRK